MMLNVAGWWLVGTTVSAHYCSKSASATDTKQKEQWQVHAG